MMVLLFSIGVAYIVLQRGDYLLGTCAMIVAYVTLWKATSEDFLSDTRSIS